MARRYQGTVRYFDTEKGCGMITPDEETLPELFVHYVSIDVRSGPKTLEPEQRVSFEIVETSNHGWVASNVRTGGRISLLGSWNIRRSRSKRR